MVPKIYSRTVIILFAVAFIGSLGSTAPATEQETSNVVYTEDGLSGPGSTSDMAGEADTRKKIEEQILASTVRVVIQNWIVDDNESGYTIDQSVAHATVMSGSRLVTHNHFSLPLSIRHPDGEVEAYGLVKLLDARGKQLFQAPLSEFELAWEDQETLVFAYEDESQFEALGLRPAEFVEWTSLPLEAGMEVAQVDWDGSMTRVDWTTVQEVKLDGGAPLLLLEDGVMLGASGGGIFWQGKHIANNWLLRQMFDASGTLVDSMTTVALNSAQVVGQVAASAYHDTVLPKDAIEVAVTGRKQLSESAALPSPLQPVVNETEESQGWFIVDGESHWSVEERPVVEQILARTWQALGEVGLDGQTLLDGYRFRRVAAEFVPGRERLLAIVDHQTMEITLADSAFERLHGFYIYRLLLGPFAHQRLSNDLRFNHRPAESPGYR
jgi:hypothetical protein